MFGGVKNDDIYEIGSPLYDPSFSAYSKISYSEKCDSIYLPQDLDLPFFITFQELIENDEKLNP